MEGNGSASVSSPSAACRVTRLRIGRARARSALRSRAATARTSRPTPRSRSRTRGTNGHTPWGWPATTAATAPSPHAERWEVRGQSDHAFTDRAYWFGAGRYEDDRFSAFEYPGVALDRSGVQDHRHGTHKVLGPGLPRTAIPAELIRLPAPAHRYDQDRRPVSDREQLRQHLHAERSRPRGDHLRARLACASRYQVRTTPMYSRAWRRPILLPPSD